MKYLLFFSANEDCVRQWKVSLLFYLRGLLRAVKRALFFIPFVETPRKEGNELSQYNPTLQFRDLKQGMFRIAKVSCHFTARTDFLYSKLAYRFIAFSKRTKN